jgi:hypothetical protein
VKGGLVSGEELGIFDGAVVMDLAPLGFDAAKDARGAEVQVEASFSCFQVGFEVAAFATHCVENIVKDVHGVVVKFHGHFVGTVKDTLVDRFDFLPAAFDAAKGIVHGDFQGVVPVFGHAGEVAVVEGAVELREGLDGLGEVAEIFLAGDGLLDGKGGGHREAPGQFDAKKIVEDTHNLNDLLDGMEKMFLWKEEKDYHGGNRGATEFAEKREPRPTRETGPSKLRASVWVTRANKIGSANVGLVAALPPLRAANCATLRSG